ncbi:Acyl transferase/acyl hydrolase/lysophospholipase [Penicillium italicum]|uniref:Acyl transferase/acyl hydrolase/lysophospholipase n=2 Tax=Penicillium TaxID=5073 RepID=A0A0A2L3N8_PENIT|nr:Acyl transferase/acyl hydrolase/lysophospholipase [Penicillium italicum]
MQFTAINMISSESFWDMIVEGRCASTDFPPDRLNIDSHHNLDTSRLDSLSLRGGHFMKEDVALFDAPFFSITAAEAEAMDPQQRLILEATFRALENAGITMEGIARSKTCVFACSSGHEYLMLQAKDPQYLQKWGITGTTGNMVANRISWFFDLIGPSAAIDTACSSSLMAIDMACQSIWSGDSTMGLAIGSNVILALETSLMMDNLGLLSKDSRCYSFDERGNGHARGEGVGVLVIRPLEDAVRNGDTVRAIIRSSASNQDGRTTGITQPSTEMQATLIQEAYRKAGLDMATTRYFEAHGTGTAIGDSIETSAIGSVFRPHNSLDNPLYIGSVKSNIGHLEGASGVAGVIKTVLALEKGIIPPNSVNLQSLNPRIDDEFLNIKFPQKALPWPSEGLRRASVSSLGYGGSNAHIVLDDAYHFMKLNGLKGNHNTVLPSQLSKCRDCDFDTGGKIVSDGTGFNGLTETTDDIPKLLVWSAADEKGILRLKETWKSRFPKISQSNKKSPKFLNDLAHTLASRRSHLSWRSFAVARPSDDLGALVDRFSPASQSRGSPNLAMVFSGQGAQWYAMGRQLLDVYPVFLKSIEDAGEYLQTLGCEWMPLDELERNESTSNINKTEYSQILCTILQVALVDLLRSVNITPKAVLGHSSGEVAAAYCARAISRQSAWKVSYYRGYMSSKLEKSSQMRGSMLAVGLSEQGIKPYIDKLRKDLEDFNLIVGCINSPKSVTVTGEVTQLDSLKIILDKDNILCRRLKVNLAYHSPQMKEVAALYQDALGELEAGYTGNKNITEMVSSVTGDWIDPGKVSQAAYWVKNMVSPVRFSDGLTTLCSGSAPNSRKRLDGSHRRARNIDHILEVGPHSVLQGACKDVLKNIKNDKTTEYLSLLVRNMSAADTAFAVFGNLHIAGYPIDLSLVNGIDSAGDEIPKSLPDLPEYPFNHDTSYWHESKISKDHRLHPFGRNDLLGVSDPNCNPFEMRWRNFVRVSEMPWTKGHQVNGTIVYPGAGMLVMAIEAAKQVAEQGRTISGFNIQEARFHASMIVPPGTHGIETSFYLRPTKGMDPKSSSCFEFRLCTCENEEWIENCTGSIKVVYNSDEEELEMDKMHQDELWSLQLEAYSDATKACTLQVDGSSLYDRFLNSGYDYGEAFQLIDTLSLSPMKPCVTAHVKRVSSTGETIHPTTLDAILQTSVWTEVASETDKVPAVVPKCVRNLWIASAFENTPSGILRTFATRTVGPSCPSLSSDIFVFDEALSQTLVSVEGIELEVDEMELAVENSTASPEELCYQVQWKPDLNLLSNRETTDLCKKGYPKLAGETEAFFADLDFVFMARITETLKRLSEQQLKPQQPHLQKYVDWMIHRQLNKDQLVDLEYLQDVENRLLNLNKRGHFYVTVARNLLKFLTGEMNSSTFFEGDMMKEFYSEEVHESQGIKQSGKYLDLLSHLNPRMKILEVGAGIGSMTEVMLRTLGNTENSNPQFAQWDFTDKSESSFAAAQDQFHQETGRMQFKLLDIEQDPEQQGFECGTYDIVVASMVVHSTSNIKAALGNARKLLKPGGKLMLYEMISPDVRSTFTFGLLEQFWLNSVTDSEPGLCFDERQWNELLLQTGFSGLDFLLPDFDKIGSHGYGLIVSTAAEEPPTVHPVPEIEIVYDVTESGQQELAQFLVKYCQSNKLAPVRSSSTQEAIENTSENPLLRIFLFELHVPVLSEIQPELFQQLQSLLSSTSQALWINQGGGILPSQPQFHLVDGLFRALMTEDSKHKLHLLSLEPRGPLDTKQRDHITRLIRFFLSPSASKADTEYVEQDGVLNIPRLIASKPLNESISSMATSHQYCKQSFNCQTPLRLNTASASLTNGFEFIEDETAYNPLQPDEIEIEIKCAGLNSHEDLIAAGRLESSDTGFECSGYVIRVGDACERFQVGDSVAVLHNGCFATSIRLRETGPVVKIPAGISLENAAAVPVNFATAHIALHNVARIQAGETMLIHSASTDTGQAAIQIAKNAGATIFTTVSSEFKKKLLMDVYGIPASHIFSSRTTVFAKMIKHRTGGKGVDVILNSLTGEGLFESWRCIAPYGRFIEIGKRDILSNQGLPMLQFLENVTFSGIDLAAMSVERPEVCIDALKSVFASIQAGSLHPSQPINVYGVGEMEEAFGKMQTDQHVGKVVIEMRGHDQVKTALRTRPSFALDANATFVVSGAFGGLGRKIACWLADQGARHLLLLSRSGAQSEKSKDLIKHLELKGVMVLAPSCDISNGESLDNALRESQSQMPRIKGCIQAAMVSRDACFEEMSYQFWQESISPKVQGSWNLHRNLPQEMDFFILLSSLSGLLGSTGQANHAAGNTFHDALARYRARLGEKATSLDLGLCDFAGAVPDNGRPKELLPGNHGLAPVTEAQFHALLAKYCDPRIGISTPLDCQTVVGLSPRALSDKKHWQDNPLVRHLITNERLEGKEGSLLRSTKGAGSLIQAETLADANAAVLELSTEKLSKTVSMAMADVDANTPLHQYGVDSLVAVELRDWFAEELQAELGVFEILGGATLASVSQLAAKKSNLVQAS